MTYCGNYGIIKELDSNDEGWTKVWEYMWRVFPQTKDCADVDMTFTMENTLRLYDVFENKDMLNIQSYFNAIGHPTNLQVIDIVENMEHLVVNRRIPHVAQLGAEYVLFLEAKSGLGLNGLLYAEGLVDLLGIKVLEEMEKIYKFVAIHSGKLIVDTREKKDELAEKVYKEAFAKFSLMDSWDKDIIDCYLVYENGTMDSHLVEAMDKYNRGKLEFMRECKDYTDVALGLWEGSINIPFNSCADIDETTAGFFIKMMVKNYRVATFINDGFFIDATFYDEEE